MRPGPPSIRRVSGLLDEGGRGCSCAPALCVRPSCILPSFRRKPESMTDEVDMLRHFIFPPCAGLTEKNKTQNTWIPAFAGMTIIDPHASAFAVGSASATIVPSAVRIDPQVWSNHARADDQIQPTPHRIDLTLSSRRRRRIEGPAPMRPGPPSPFRNRSEKRGLNLSRRCCKLSETPISGRSEQPRVSYGA